MYFYSLKLLASCDPFCTNENIYSVASFPQIVLIATIKFVEEMWAVFIIITLGFNLNNFLAVIKFALLIKVS